MLKSVEILMGEETMENGTETRFSQGGSRCCGMHCQRSFRIGRTGRGRMSQEYIGR